MQKQNDPNKMEGQQRGGQEGGIGSPISNDAYNVLTALHSKLEGLEAYRKFSRDGDRAIWKEMSESDVRCVERLVDELERMVRDGKFRVSAAGSGGATKQGEKPRS